MPCKRYSVLCVSVSVDKKLNNLPYGADNNYSIFICSALQIPPEAWLRISLNHASITWISIQPSGRVTLRLLGDSGHIPPECVTSR